MKSSSYCEQTQKGKCKSIAFLCFSEGPQKRAAPLSGLQRLYHTASFQMTAALTAI
jgi:hypothetical protein